MNQTEYVKHSLLHMKAFAKYFSNELFPNNFVLAAYCLPTLQIETICMSKDSSHAQLGCVQPLCFCPSLDRCVFVTLGLGRSGLSVVFMSTADRVQSG